MKKLMIVAALAFSVAFTAHANTAKAKPIAKPLVKHFNGMVIKRDSLGMVTLDDLLAAVDEQNPNNTVYSQGFYTIIIYKNGKVAILKNGQFEGYAK